MPSDRPDSGRPQAIAPPTRPVTADAFAPAADTTLRWLGMAGFLLNARGTTAMIDPVLHSFDMPLLIDIPLAVADLGHLDAVLITHVDNDHFSRPTCRDLAATTDEFHATHYVAGLAREDGWEGATGHGWGDRFTVGHLEVAVTPADHAWQNARPKPGQRTFADDDACGFWIDTPDGSIWAPGDSRLIPDHHLMMPAPDVLIFDFSDNDWHFGFEGAVSMANAYPEADLVLHHWGSVDAPNFSPFNADPADLPARVVNPERIRVVAPGEPFEVRRR